MVSCNQMNSLLNELVKCTGLKQFHKECDRVNLEDYRTCCSMGIIIEDSTKMRSVELSLKKNKTIL